MANTPEQIAELANQSAPNDAAAMADQMKELDEEIETPEGSTSAPDEEPAVSTLPAEQNEQETPSQDENPTPEETEEPESKPEDQESDKKDESGDERPPEEDEFEKELDAIKTKHDAPAKTKKAVAVLKEKAKAEHAKVKELTAEIVQLKEATAKIKPLDEQTETKLKELETFHRNVNFEHEINNEYGPKVQAVEKEAFDAIASESIPQQHRIPEKLTEYIASKGGILNFRQSDEFMPLGVKDGEGNPILNKDGTPLTRRQFYTAWIEPNLTVEQKESIADAGLERRKLFRERNQKLETARADSENFLKGRQETQEKQQKDYAERVQKRATEYVKTFGEIAQKKEIPTNATAEEKAEFEKHNKRVDRAAGIARKYLSDFTPETRVEAALNSAYVETMKELDKQKDDEIAELKKQVKERDEKIDKIKNAGRVTNRNSAPPPAKEAKPTTNASSEDAMTAMMEEV